MDLKITETSKKDSEKGMKIIGTYISEEMYQNLQNEANEDFMSISSLLRKILYHYIKDKNKNC